MINKANSNRILLFISLFFFIAFGYCSDLYILCGPDEDGCYDKIAQWCVCIPYDEQEGNQPYCLDFDLLRCTPLREQPNCRSNFTFKNQASCVAAIFQSGSEPPCPLTTRDYCIQHHTPFCDMDGRLESCH